jgi:hypothetical protein
MIPMKNKLILLSLALLLPCSAGAAIYVEPRMSFLDIKGTPSIGDIGQVTRSDTPEVAPGIGVGYELASRVKLELRFTYLGTIELRKFSPIYSIFPPGPADAVLTVIRPYEYKETSRLFSLAVPVTVVKTGRVSLALTPLLHAHDSNIELVDLFTVLENGLSVVPGRHVIRRENDAVIRPGGELAFDFAFDRHLTFSLHYSYSELKTFNAHLVGGGLRWRF